MGLDKEPKKGLDKKLKKRLKRIDEYNSFLNYRLTKAEDDIKILMALHREEIATMLMIKKEKE